MRNDCRLTSGRCVAAAACLLKGVRRKPLRSAIVLTLERHDLELFAARIRLDGFPRLDAADLRQAILARTDSIDVTTLLIESLLLIAARRDKITLSTLPAYLPIRDHLDETENPNSARP